MSLSKVTMEIFKVIRTTSLLDSEFSHLHNRITNEEVASKGYSDINEILLLQGINLIPDDATLKPFLLTEFHSLVIGGHAGIFRTFQHLAANFLWKAEEPRKWDTYLEWAEYWYNTAHQMLPAQFFSYLTITINPVISSCKRQDQLREAQASHIADMMAFEGLDIGNGKNQIGTLQRTRDTTHGSHLTSLLSLLKMIDSTCSILKNIISDGNLTQRSEADSVYDVMTSFEVVVILHLMIDLLSITDDISQALQRKSQDILYLKRFKDDMVELLKLSSSLDPRNVGNCYHVDIFLSVIDSQIHEMNVRFKDDMVELLKLSSSLDPRNGYKSFSLMIYAS
ncbi:hypothetical protein GQ457_03G014970 [Hibiscus cannabinus]